MYRLHHHSQPESQSRNRRLPGLHDVLGDVLEQPLRSYSPHESHMVTSHYEGHRQSGPHLPPLGSYNQQRSSTPHPSSSVSANQAQAAPSQHAYHLFNYSPNKGLVHQRTSSQEQDLEPAHPRPRLPPSDPSRKYVCADCGNRFSKHSTLRNHLLTHSGEKPYECTFPGCGRRFSMACNMQRHLRTHTSASAFEHDTSSPDSHNHVHSRMTSLPPSTRTASRGSSRDGSSRGDSPRDGGSHSYYHSL